VDSFGAPLTVSGGMGGEALSDSASNGGSDAPNREVLVGEIVAREPTGTRASNGGGDAPGEGPDSPRP
jgi:hypothetical protein